VEAPVTGVEQVEDFDARFLGSKVLKSLANVPCGDVFPLAETGSENENFLQNPRRLYSPLPL
jgi:hypothetical protein